MTAPLLPSRVRSRERGSGLVELLAVGAVMLLMAAAVTALISAWGRGATRPERTQSIDEATTAFHEMTRQLRRAYAVNSIDYVRIDVNTRIRGRAGRRVAYDCGVEAITAGLGSCVRYEGPVGHPLPARGIVVIDSILNGRNDAGGRVFFAGDSGRPGFVRAKVDLAGNGPELEGYRDRVVLDDRVQLLGAQPRRRAPSP